ncbi:hypothetical protein O181_120726, partial [Austropuccinia psidii MF-1]|nr:hypothetical protein [Austropuccinia psidii MF-1]
MNVSGLNIHQGESRVNRRRLTSHRTARQDNVNRHMCHMRMSLKAQTHFNTMRNVCVISPHWLPPPRRLACLRTRTALHPDETPTLPAPL